jgi:hypothetical protein
MQGVDLSKIRGGRRGQQRVAQAVAMESANRVLTRRALDTLKSIAMGEYVPPEERQQAEEEPAAEAASPREEVNEGEEPAPETERLVAPSNEAGQSVDEDQETEPTESVVGDTAVDPETKSE